MKNTALNLTIFAAAMLASASILPAQTMKAEIPFSFEASGARMQPGTYAVQIDRTVGGQSTVRLVNWDTHRSVVALPYSEPARQPVSSTATLTFLCVDSQCALQQMRDSQSNVLRFHPARVGHGEARIATVLLRSDKAD